MSYASTVLADSPVAYYRLGELSGATTAEDETGTHDGTYVNAPTLEVAGAVDDGNTACTFNGTDERVLTTTLGTLGSNLLTSSWEWWVKTTTTANRTMWGTLNTGSTLIIRVAANTDTTTETASTGDTFVQVRGQNGSSLRGEITTNIYDGNWHHCVVVIESGTSPSSFSFYVDGVSRTVTYNLQQTITGANFDFAPTIGARNSRGTIDQFFPGSIDEFACYATRLNSSQVAAHYAAAAPPASALRLLAATGVGT